MPKERLIGVTRRSRPKRTASATVASLKRRRGRRRRLIVWSMTSSLFLQSLAEERGGATQKTAQRRSPIRTSRPIEPDHVHEASGVGRNGRLPRAEPAIEALARWPSVVFEPGPAAIACVKRLELGPELGIGRVGARAAVEPRQMAQHERIALV